VLYIMCPCLVEGYLEPRRLLDVLDMVIIFNLLYYIVLHTFRRRRRQRRRMQEISTEGDLWMSIN